MADRYIRRDTAITKACNAIKDAGIAWDVKEALKAVPVADVRRNLHGLWIKDDTGAAYCSWCGRYPYDDGEYRISGWFPDYCPNCGAALRLEEDLKDEDDQ